MNDDLLIDLGFENLSYWIFKHCNIQIEFIDIYIQSKKEVPKLKICNSFNTYDMLCHSFTIVDKTNQLVNGYDKKLKSWININTSLNCLRSKIWNTIFHKIGYEYSIFILTNCNIIQNYNGNYILIAGYLDKTQKEEKDFSITRNMIFKNNFNLRKKCNNKIFEFIFKDLEIPKHVEDNIRKTLNIFQKKYEILNIKTIFNTFFKNEIWAVDYLKIINFLFLISKKISKSIFSYYNFKVLKGKLSLLIKKNAYEELGMQELMMYFRIDEFQIFKTSKRWHNGFIKYKIVNRLLVYLMNEIYLPIISFFFHSIQINGFNYRIFYFKRKNWNECMNRYVNLYLEQSNYTKENKMYNEISSIISKKQYLNEENLNKNKQYLNLCNEDIQKIKTEEKKNIGYLRFIPKSTGHKTHDIFPNIEFRPIIDCSKVVKNNVLYKIIGKKYSINKYSIKLLPILQSIISNEFNNKSMKYCDITKELYKYICKKKPNYKEYIIKFDLVQCFENIKQKYLLKIIDDILKDKYYFSSEYKILQKNAFSNEYQINNIRKSYNLVYPIDRIGELFNIFKTNDKINYQKNKIEKSKNGFNKYNRKLNNELIEYNNNKKVNNENIKNNSNSNEFYLKIHKNCFNYKIKRQRIYFKEGIIKEQGHFIISSDDIRRQLYDIIKNMYILYKNKYYKRLEGIPQGWCLSSALCDLYYNYIENKYFKNILKNGKIIRYVDDFLFLTSDLNDINKLLETINNLKEIGIIINKNKIETNLSEEEIKKIDNKLIYNLNNEYIKWCGIKINVNKQSIKIDIKNNYFRYSIILPKISTGRMVFNKIAKTFILKLGLKLYIHQSNKMIGECIFDLFYYIGRQIRILFLRCNFINLKFVNFILKWCIIQMQTIIKERNINIKPEKIEMIAKSAFEKTNTFNFKKKKWK